MLENNLPVWPAQSVFWQLVAGKHKLEFSAGMDSFIASNAKWFKDGFVHQLLPPGKEKPPFRAGSKYYWKPWAWLKQMTRERHFVSSVQVTSWGYNIYMFIKISLCFWRTWPASCYEGVTMETMSHVRRALSGQFPLWKGPRHTA